MTKAVRIENADTSDYKLVVQVWDKSHDPNAPDVMVQEVPLRYPTEICTEYVHSSRYLVVKEGD